jgi:hypothetical protein
MTRQNNRGVGRRFFVAMGAAAALGVMLAAARAPQWVCLVVVGLTAFVAVPLIQMPLSEWREAWRNRGAS